MKQTSVTPPFISSAHNPQLKRWISLFESKGIKKHGQCLVFGEKLVSEILCQHTASCVELLSSPKSFSPVNDPAHIVHATLAHHLFNKLDRFGTQSSILVCHSPHISHLDLAQAPQGLEIIFPGGDPSNLGALVRSCVAFGVQRLILTKESCHPFHPKAIRASSGTVFRQPMSWGPGIQDLHHPDILRWIAPLDLQGEPLTTWRWDKNVRVLIGEEGQGLPSFPFPMRITIPQTTHTNSLNVAVAAGIALFTYRQQFPEN